MAKLNPLFVSRMEDLGIPQNERLIDTLENTEASVSVRLNPVKPCEEILSLEQVVPWSEGRGFYLSERPLFTVVPQLHQGAFYVQDASSMFICHVVRQLTANMGAVVYLDACAAPGGKTTAAIDSLPQNSFVFANEYDFRRAQVLKENVVKWGNPNVLVSRGDTRRYRKFKETFDIIAADVPCSGEGMFRKDEEAVKQWSPRLVAECAERQKEIIDNLWNALRPGGYMIYSTCTFNREENEDMVCHILENYDAESVKIDTNPEWGIVESPLLPDGVFGYRFVPGIIRGEGLFMAVLRRNGEPKTVKNQKKQVRKLQKESPLIRQVVGWIVKPESYEFKIDNDEVHAVPMRYKELIDKGMAELDVVHKGICVATIKGKSIVPNHSLAMSTAFNLEAIPAVEVDKAIALNYLRRESVTLPEGVPCGYVLLTYASLPLGFVKNLGNRANNLYPEHWKIMKR